MIELYAKTFGISDLDIAEAPWLKSWIKRHHNNLKYDVFTCRFVWVN